MLDDIVIHREDLNIKSKDEVNKSRLDKMNKFHQEVLGDALKDIDFQIKCNAEEGYKWMAYYLKDNYKYDGVYEDIVDILSRRGYEARIHKIVADGKVISIAMSIPFQEVENDIKKYISHENKFNISIVAGFSIIPIAIIMAIIFCR